MRVPRTSRLTVRIIQAKHHLALGEGDASVHSVTPSFRTRNYRGSRVISIGLCVALLVPPVHLCEAWDRLDHLSVEMPVFPALLLCDVCKGTYARDRPRLAKLVRYRDGQRCRLRVLRRAVCVADNHTMVFPTA